MCKETLKINVIFEHQFPIISTLSVAALAEINSISIECVVIYNWILFLLLIMYLCVWGCWVGMTYNMRKQLLYYSAAEFLV